eukprot:6303549-Alexandrium_andersonii.AAC.1
MRIGMPTRQLRASRGWSALWGAAPTRRTRMQRWHAAQRRLRTLPRGTARPRRQLARPRSGAWIWAP